MCIHVCVCFCLVIFWWESCCLGLIWLDGNIILFCFLDFGEGFFFFAILDFFLRQDLTLGG